MIKKLFITKNSTIKNSLEILGKSGHKCLIVIDKKNHFLGTLSDGDIRRKGLLKGMTMKDSIESIYEKNSVYLSEDMYTIKEAKDIFLNKKFDLIPIVNIENKVVDVLFWEKVFKNQNNKKNKGMKAPVVIMAGGKGTRLEPFTNILPKPLIPINEKPIIEYIIENFTKIGSKEFYFSVNYKSRILKAYFEELQPNYLFDFVEEEKPLGTAGSLSYLRKKIDKPFFVTNCDMLVEIDFNDLYNFHIKNRFDITLVASAKEYIIPYGTCELNKDGHLSHINEKPQFDFLINAGLYVLNPEVLNIIPENTEYHITTLIEDIKNSGKNVGVYPIDENSWIDIGQWAEYKKAVEKL